MDQQKKSSKAGSSFVSKLPAASGVDETIFLGYEDLKSESKVLVLWIDQERVDEANENQEIFIACNQTPFYAESGGQVGDKGRFSSSNSSGAILDCKKQGKVFIHKALVEKGSLKVGDVINMNVEKDKRLATAIHHSSTHLLHSALRSILGEHVQQKGSLVDESKLRFDFSHGKPLSKEEIDSIEEIVNNEVLNNVDVSTKIMKLDDAMNSGAQALFGEKYDEEVRVLSMGSDSFSVELCGGTHVKRTGDIGVFVITAQSSVASGIRRIEAVAGKKALSYISEIRKVNNSLQEILNTPVDAMNEKIQSLIDENKKLKKSGGVTSSNADVVSSDVMDIDDWKLVVEHISIEDAKQLRGLVDQKKQSLDKGCVVLLNSHNNKVAVVSGVTDNLLDVISAKDVVSSLCEKLNGRGGGRPDFAQGAGESENINEFVTSIPALVKSLAK
jgi:alanyl-tRNA synthetase